MINTVLKNWNEVEDAAKELLKNNLPPHPDFVKCWDTWKMVNFIKNKGLKDSHILDIGCNGSPILPFLKKIGFTHLFGCDIDLKIRKRRLLRRLQNKIYHKDPDKLINEMLENKNKFFSLSVQDLQNTKYQDEEFDFITSLSVIEHGVNIKNYFKEMRRILKPKGYLLTSTDYWPEKIETSSDMYKTGGVDGIFDKKEIERIIDLAVEEEFRLIEPVKFEFQDKVIHWKKTDKRFTFIFFCLQKK